MPKVFRVWNNNINNFKSRNGRCYEKIKYHEDFDLLINGVHKTIENKQKKEQKSKFLGMLLGTLSARLSKNMLSGKGFIQSCNGFIGEDKEIISPRGQ